MAGDCPSLMGYEDFGPLNQGARDVAVLGSYAFTADFFGMTVYDVRDATNPIHKADLLLPKKGSAIAVTDSVALVAAFDTGLQIIDISNPSAPTLIGNAASGEEIIDVAVEGDFVYLISAPSKLLVFNISDPAAPIHVASLDTFLDARALVTAHQTVYIADLTKGLEIVDVSNPSSPILLGNFPWPIQVPGAAGFLQLAISEDLVVALPPSGNFSYVIDVSDPTHPAEVSQLEASHRGLSVQMADSIAYVSDSYGNLNVFDLSNRTDPELLAVLEHGGTIREMCVSGEKLYLPDSSGFRILDVSNPSNPNLLATTAAGGFAFHLDIADGVANVANWNGGLQLIDTTFPLDPNLMGSYDPELRVVDVVSDSGVAYILVPGLGLETIDVSNPWSPTLLGTFPIPSFSSLEVALSEGRAYVLGSDVALDIIDVSVPTAPILLGHLDASPMEGASSLAVSDHIVYISGVPFGLRMIDVSNPANPILLGDQAIPSTWDIQVVGDLAYLTLSNGLHVFNISDPGNPYLLGNVGDQGYRFSLSGGLAFLATGPDLQIIDISDSMNPEIVTSVATRHPTWDVAIDPLTSTAWLAEGAIVEAVNLGCTTCAGLGLSATPTMIEVGGQHATISVKVGDLAGRPVSNATVEASTSLGFLSSFIDEGDGSYTATLEPGTVPGVALISVEVDGMSCSSNLEVRIFSNLDTSIGQSGNFIPVASRGTGAHGARWKTSLGILSRGETENEILVQYLGEDPPLEKRIPIAPGWQILLPDIMGWMGAEGSGAIKVLSEEPILLTSRSYSEVDLGGACPPGGTLGQFLAAEDQSPSLDAGEAAFLPNLVENENFRSNIALTNTADVPAVVRVRLYLGNGAEAGAFVLKLWPGEWIQENRPFEKYCNVADLDAGWARVEVLSGAGIIGYASIIDNRSNDPMTIPLIPVGEGESTDTWIPVASNLPGAHQSQWRSELGILNPGWNEVSVEIDFDNGLGNPLHQQLCARCQLRIVDLLGDMGVTGTAPVHITASEPVIASSRIYSFGNEDDPCRPAGTMGQFLPASSYSELLESGQKGFLPQLVENASFRSNISLMNTSGMSARADVSLYDAEGNRLGSYELELDPGERKQTFRPFFFVTGREDLSACYATVEVLQGTGVMSYASVVDNLTNDATTIPLSILEDS
jgi:hypothetical protein